jgi:hydrogenase expression/formation protein HypE
MKNDIILLNHGSGGRLTRQLIDEVFGRHFANPLLDGRTDASILSLDSPSVAFTTDSFVVEPRFFPGGDIGKLAVCGTVNDVAVSGAVPVALSASFIIEEGFSIKELDTIVASMAETAKMASVSIVTGDTKVVNHGKADGVFITTTGIGTINPAFSSIGSGAAVKPGDKVIINGPVGDHGMSILAARNDLPFKAQVKSDCAPLNVMLREVMGECGEAVTFMRDATRGGLGTVLCELAEMVQCGISIKEHVVPVRQVVRSMCDMFGFDPLFIANEGKVVMTVRPDVAQRVVEILRSHPFGGDTAIIGEVADNDSDRVTLKTAIGGSRIIAIPAGDQLPRIC